MTQLAFSWGQDGPPRQSIRTSSCVLEASAHHAAPETDSQHVHMHTHTHSTCTRVHGRTGPRGHPLPPPPAWGRPGKAEPTQERTEGSQGDSRLPGGGPSAVPALHRAGGAEKTLCTLGDPWPGSRPPPTPGPQGPGLTGAGRGLYQPVVEGQRLHDGGVGLGALLELLQRQLAVGVLQAEAALSGRDSLAGGTA